MAEAVIYAVLPMLLDKLMSSELIRFATQGDVDSKLKKWEKTLKMINALLIDAEEKQLEDEAMKKWLEELQDLAYDAEDILDAYATEALRRKLESKEHQAATSGARWNLIAACCSGPTPQALWSDFNMHSKIDEITSRFQELCKRRTEFRLVDISGERSTASSQRTPTTSSQIESAVYGRDEDKAKIHEMMLNDKPGHANFDVITIVGMGGLGKTTLARTVYNDTATEDFYLKGWVCVSDDFDVAKTSKAILECFTDGPSNLWDLNSIQAQLRNEVSGRKFLLVLDDVWSANFSKWDVLLSPLMDGAPGSKIIVTTRHEDVAFTVTSSSEYCHRLGLLSDNDCWSLFKEQSSRIAVMGGAPYSEFIRQKVIEKCHGLPLAVKALSGILCSREMDQWLHILNCETWELLGESEVFAALQLSYHHLPLHLKRCFAYCAIFPKGYEFEEKEAVLLWIAHDLIQLSRSNTQPEDIGGEYFHDLVSRSIFLKSSQNNSKYIMHDLFNAFAQMVFGSRSFRLEYQNSKPLRSFKSIRHISSICYPYDGKFEVLSDVTPLRTFLSLLPVGNWYKPHYTSEMFVSDLLQKFKKLRALSLQDYNIIKLPNSIEGLTLLRYLNLSGSKIRSLPESVNSLCNLQMLILRNCHNLLKLPHSMENLIKLRHFDILGASSIDKMPLGIRNWKYVRTLSNFIVGEGSCSSLKDLKNLKFLCGGLHISKLENMVDFENIPETILSDKKDLKVLLLDWGSKSDDPRDGRVEEMVLDMLQPHQNLEELTIRSYCGIQFSSWLGDHAFSMSSGITILKLEDCIRCTSLPSLGLLGSLKKLTVKGMLGIESVGFEFYGESCLKPFPSLETLSFEGLEEWEEWTHVEEDEHVESFPKLRELSIVRCTKLRGRLPNHLFLLEKLVIRSCKELTVSFSTLPKLCKLEIDECKEIVCDSPLGFKSLNSMLLSNVSDIGNWLREDFRRVEVLSIKGCDELANLWQKEIFLEEPPQGLFSVNSLRELCIAQCNTITTLLEGILKINAGLEKLRIESCHSLTFIVKGQLPAFLKRLVIRNCTKLQLLLEDNGDSSSSSSSSAVTHPLQKILLLENVNTSMPHLEELYIQDCPSLIRLPSIDQFSVSLTHLHIKKCSKLTTLSSRSLLPTALKYLEIENCLELRTLLQRGQLPETLESLKISWCPKLKSIVERFHNNTTLREIWIEGCEELKFLPEGIDDLTSLRDVGISYCPRFVSLPECGFPNTNLRVWIKTCEKLKALPSQMHTLTSLQLLSLCDCPSMSFSAEGLPTNLESLAIQGHNFYKALKKEDLLKFTSLKELSICGLPDILSFQVQKIEKTLPSTLTRLYIGNFPNLKELSLMNLQNLTNLKWLSIDNCPNLKSLPSLPLSLLELYANKCPLLKIRNRVVQDN